MNETTMAAPVIQVSGLTKSYGEGRGIFDLSFSVEHGEVFGFLGPNGAGKTVTMRHLMGFIRPDAGSASILGMDCFRERDRIQTRTGYLPGEMALMDDMTAGAYLSLIARMRGMGDLARAGELAERFELDCRARIRSMSKGNRQKVGIVSAFMGAPDILLLDEPTSGLDPIMQERFIDLLLEERQRGTAVLLSSHLFGEVSRTCDRVAFIRQGRIAAIETMEEVRGSHARNLEVAFASREERERYLGAHADAERLGDRKVRLALGGNADALVKDLAGYRIADLATRERTLEEVFRDLYGDVS